MKKVFLLLAFFIANYAFAKADNEPKELVCINAPIEVYSTENSIASDISLVTVYLNGAQVERTSNASVKDGTTTFIFENLSNTVDENSIQVSGLGEASILSINYSIDYLKKQKNTEAVEALQKEKKEIEFRIKKLNNLIIGLQKEEEVISLNQKLGSTTQEVSLEKVKALATYYRQRVTAIKNEILDTERKRYELQIKNQDLTKQFNELNITEEKSTGKITLKINSERQATLQLKLKYNVANAGWYPIYDLKAKTIDAPLDLAYKAHVYQNTGTSWEDVSLVISTGDPNTNNTKPEVNTKYLQFVNNYYNNRQKRALGYATSEVLEEDLAYELSGKASGVSVAGNTSAPVNYTATGDIKLDGLTTTRFEIKKKYSIPSDGDVTVIEVDTFKIPATYQYFAAPLLNENVFLTASIKDWAQYSLLPGEANIYLEGSFSGKTFIDPLATTEELTVSLGVDPNVVVEREQLDNFKATSFIGTQRIVDNKYEIKIKNNKSTNINIKLVDRIPKSQNKEIKVDDIETGDAAYDKETGLLKWTLSIAPNSPIEKRFSYELRYPKSKRINL
ncbi:MAG: hypothetical protein ACI9Y7_001059 [Dokdonia sp.]|jgi:uncharacterized protein (TIGR02231 family)